MTEEPIRGGDPRGTVEYLLGQLVIKVDAMDSKLTELCDEMKEDKDRRDRLENRVDGLESWRDRHVEFHRKEQDNIIISKSTFWTVVGIIVASGIILRLLEVWT